MTTFIYWQKYADDIITFFTGTEKNYPVFFEFYQYYPSKNTIHDET